MSLSMNAQCYVCGAEIRIAMSQLKKVMCSLCEADQANETSAPNEQLSI